MILAWGVSSMILLICYANALPVLITRGDIDPYTPSNQTCDDAGYDPNEASSGPTQPTNPSQDSQILTLKLAQYICRHGILCPVVNGEPLSLCGRACYSQYLYTCTSGTDLHLRRHQPALASRVVLRATNPRRALVDNLPMTACGRAWTLGNETCAYCPEQVPEGGCPAGNATVVDTGDPAAGRSSNAMGVLVPGGQKYYLTRDWTVGYTQAHSASIPEGATLDGFAAFEGGGFFNLLDGAKGWAACKARRGGRMVLKVRNGTNEGELAGCVGLNLVMEVFEGGFGAWEYT